MTMRTSTRITGVLLAATTLGGINAGTALAATPTSPTAPQATVPAEPSQVVGPQYPAQLTQGRDFRNFSAHPLRYEGYTSSDGGALQGGGPATGTTVTPGGTLHFEQIYYFAKDTSVDLQFQELNSAGKPMGTPVSFFRLTIDGINTPSASDISCPADLTCSINGFGTSNLLDVHDR
jgi:hypothetical protein